MKNLELRIDELELRIRDLEKEVAVLRSEKDPAQDLSSRYRTTHPAIMQDDPVRTQAAPHTDHAAARMEGLQIEKNMPIHEQTEPSFDRNTMLIDREATYDKRATQAEASTKHPRESKKQGFFADMVRPKRPIDPAQQSARPGEDRESLVGKYIIGALAALLVFIGAASFVAIVWDHISDEMKLAIIGASGVLLTAVGLNLALKKPNVITSILLGTGSGLVYISILSANLAFHFIGHSTSTLLCALWTALLMLSYRYTGLFFTVIVAYIGSYVNLLLELDRAQTTNDLLLILFFVTSVSVIMIYTSHNSGKTKYAVSILLSSLSYATLLFIRVTEGLSQNDQYIVPVLCFVAIFVLNNLLYRLANREKMRAAHYITTLLMSASLFWVLAYVDLPYPGNTDRDRIFFSIHLIQAVLNHFLYKEIEEKMLPYSVILLYISSIIVIHRVFEVWSAASVIILLLLLRDRSRATEKTFTLAIPILLIDLLTLPTGYFASYEHNDLLYREWTRALFALVNVGLVIFMVTKPRDRRFFKMIAALFALIVNSYYVIERILFATELSYLSSGIERSIGYFGIALILFGLYRSGLFRVEPAQSDSRWSTVIATQNDAVYYIAGLLYFVGLAWLDAYYGSFALQFILAISILAVAMLQTGIALKRTRVPRTLEIWSVFKYLIYTWTALKVFSELPFGSVSYSISGLLLAVAAIYIGFKIRAMTTRRFGLAIAMLMVAKFIFIDLSGQNSMTRVIAFVAGGVLCFLISVIYNKLSKER